MTEARQKFMLACTPRGVNVARERDSAGLMINLTMGVTSRSGKGGVPVAEVRIEDGIIRVVELEVQDPKAAAALAEYPEARWTEVTRRALKIGLGYLRGGAQD